MDPASLNDGHQFNFKQVYRSKLDGTKVLFPSGEESISLKQDIENRLGEIARNSLKNLDPRNNEREASHVLGHAPYESEMLRPSGSLIDASSVLSKMVNHKVSILRYDPNPKSRKDADRKELYIKELKANREKQLAIFKPGNVIYKQLVKMVSNASVKNDPHYLVNDAKGYLDDEFDREEKITEQLLDLGMNRVAATRLENAIQEGPFFTKTNLKLLNNLKTVFLFSGDLKNNGTELLSEEEFKQKQINHRSVKSSVEDIISYGMDMVNEKNPNQFNDNNIDNEQEAIYNTMKNNLEKFQRLVSPEKA
ncbi:MAG: hypothetical protein HRT47_09960 [Candidatus Caenarcaniphilales bacterium]|nr:hypothetical protein [Candidatus Caenarcaniphilales bacterium]